ncbi:MAG: hypothetical protein NT033_07620, partial [Candidatus Omnitrophica bacterium]|nr:hypothetical protein [Candidatus Omnitrophota bacterium]
DSVKWLRNKFGADSEAAARGTWDSATNSPSLLSRGLEKLRIPLTSVKMTPEAAAKVAGVLKWADNTLLFMPLVVTGIDTAVDFLDKAGQKYSGISPRYTPITDSTGKIRVEQLGNGYYAFYNRTGQLPEASKSYGKWLGFFMIPQFTPKNSQLALAARPGRKDPVTRRFTEQGFRDFQGDLAKLKTIGGLEKLSEELKNATSPEQLKGLLTDFLSNHLQSKDTEGRDVILPEDTVKLIEKAAAELSSPKMALDNSTREALKQLWEARQTQAAAGQQPAQSLRSLKFDEAVTHLEAISRAFTNRDSGALKVAIGNILYSSNKVGAIVDVLKSITGQDKPEFEVAARLYAESGKIDDLVKAINAADGLGREGIKTDLEKAFKALPGKDPLGELVVVLEAITGLKDTNDTFKTAADKYSKTDDKGQALKDLTETLARHEAFARAQVGRGLQAQETAYREHAGRIMDISTPEGKIVRMGNSPLTPERAKLARSTLETFFGDKMPTALHNAATLLDLAHGYILGAKNSGLLPKVASDNLITGKGVEVEGDKITLKGIKLTTDEGNEFTLPIIFSREEATELGVARISEGVNEGYYRGLSKESLAKKLAKDFRKLTGRKAVEDKEWLQAAQELLESGKVSINTRLELIKTYNPIKDVKTSNSVRQVLIENNPFRQLEVSGQSLKLGSVGKGLAVQVVGREFKARREAQEKKEAAVVKLKAKAAEGFILTNLQHFVKAQKLSVDERLLPEIAQRWEKAERAKSKIDLSGINFTDQAVKKAIEDAANNPDFLKGGMPVKAVNVNKRSLRKEIALHQAEYDYHNSIINGSGRAAISRLGAVITRMQISFAKANIAPQFRQANRRDGSESIALGKGRLSEIIDIFYAWRLARKLGLDFKNVDVREACLARIQAKSKAPELPQGKVRDVSVINNATIKTMSRRDSLLKVLDKFPTLLLKPVGRFVPTRETGVLKSELKAFTRQLKMYPDPNLDISTYREKAWEALRIQVLSKVPTAEIQRALQIAKTPGQEKIIKLNYGLFGLRQVYVSYERLSQVRNDRGINDLQRLSIQELKAHIDALKQNGKTVIQSTSGKGWEMPIDAKEDKEWVVIINKVFQAKVTEESIGDIFARAVKDGKITIDHRSGKVVLAADGLNDIVVKINSERKAEKLPELFIDEALLAKMVEVFNKSDIDPALKEGDLIQRITGEAERVVQEMKQAQGAGKDQLASV